MNVEKKKDSYVNLISGLGKRTKDKSLNNEIQADCLLEDTTLSNIYTTEGIGTNIVDAVPNDGTKNGWKYKNDSEDLIKKSMQRLGFTQAICKAWKYARLYRGAIIVAITERGALDKPFPANGGLITKLRVYSAARIDLQDADIITDVNSSYFEDVEIFRIRKKRGDGYLKVHRSRCICFYGEMIPDYESTRYPLTNQYWGLSVLERVIQRLTNFGATEQGIVNIMQEIVIGKFTLENLAQILAMSNKEAVDKILTRLEIMNASKSILNAILLGKNEKYERDNISLSGIPEIVDRMIMSLSSVARMPVSKLFKRSVAGLNSTGEFDTRDYYDDVHTQQVNHQREIDRFIQYQGLQLYKIGNLEDYGIEEFCSLWELTEKEKAEVEKLEAETEKIKMDTKKVQVDIMQILIDYQIVSPEELSTFGKNILLEEDDYIEVSNNNANNSVEDI